MIRKTTPLDTAKCGRFGELYIAPVQVAVGECVKKFDRTKEVDESDFSVILEVFIIKEHLILCRSIVTHSTKDDLIRVSDNRIEAANHKRPEPYQGFQRRILGYRLWSKPNLTVFILYNRIL